MIKRVHLVGAGGIGMSALALMAHEQGLQVTGSDRRDGERVRFLRGRGVSVHLGHQAAFVGGVDAVVYSSAIAKSCPEIQAAEEAGIPLMHRTEFLVYLMRNKRVWAIAGSHGKTTTSSLLVHLWRALGLQPSYAVGGVPLSDGSNAKMDQGPDVICEADESDGSFLKIKPYVAVVTNIDADHLENYRGDFAQVKAAFMAFMGQVADDGAVIVCLDDPVVKDVVSELTTSIITYGQHADADVRLCAMRAHASGMTLQVRAPDWGTFSIEVPLFGAHNALNTLAVLACAHKYGIEPEALQPALATFQGVGRRFQFKGQLKEGQVDWYDDYGHHPTEIEAVVRAVRQRWPERRLVMCFQPHRYSRTQSLFQAFVDVLSLCDRVILCPTFSAGEAVIEGADDDALLQALQRQGVAVTSLCAWQAQWQHDLKAGDVFLTQGAGDILTHLTPLLTAD